MFTTQAYQYTIKQYTRGGQWDKLQEPQLGGNLGKSHIYRWIRNYIYSTHKSKERFYQWKLTIQNDGASSTLFFNIASLTGQCETGLSIPDAQNVSPCCVSYMMVVSLTSSPQVKQCHDKCSFNVGK